MHDADYVHAERDCKNFETKYLGEYHDLYVQSDTILLADAFEDFRNIYFKIHKFDSVSFLSAPRLA